MRGGGRSRLDRAVSQELQDCAEPVPDRAAFIPNELRPFAWALAPFLHGVGRNTEDRCGLFCRNYGIQFDSPNCNRDFGWWYLVPACRIARWGGVRYGLGVPSARGIAGPLTE